MVTTKWILGVHAEDLADAYAIRREVFIREQGIAEEIEMDGTDASALHVVVYWDGTPAATGRLLVTRDAFMLGRLAVLPAFRGKKLGDLTVRLLVRMAFSMGGTRQHCHAQIPARGFWERMGFVAEGDIYEEAGIPHINMYHEGDVTGACSA